jgi:anti-sigma factor RsiW
MSKCTWIDPLVTPYVDGELAAADKTRVDEHLHRCPPCHARVAAEGAVRELLHTRKDSLTFEHAPEPLRTRCRALSAAARDTVVTSGRPQRTRLAPFALVAALAVLVAGAFLYQATTRSSRLLAAELAADHVKCFTVNNLLGTHDSPAVVESSMLSGFGWHLHVPEALARAGLELVGARQCLYAEGRVAHLMYLDHGRPVSIFMLPGTARPEELIHVLGHEAAIWSTGDRTFVLVTEGARADVERMTALVKGAIQ